MPQLVVLAAAAAGIYAGCRWLAREVGRAVARDATGREAAGRSIAPRDLGALEWDAEAGVYRPARRG